MSSCWLACALTILGHNPDTSYARIEISADQLHTRLTYDIFTLLTVVQLDDNADRQVSRAEMERHAPAIGQFLRDHIGLAISADDDSADLGEPAGFVWPPDTGDAIRQADYHAATGLIHFDFVRPLSEVPAEVAVYFGFFETFNDRHTVLGVFEIVGDEYEVTFTAYEPDFTYDTSVRPTMLARLWRFFKLGVEHIFLGYDHICFLIALIIVSKFREVVKVVTSFTVAHSITLILATLQVVELPTWLVETCIAATIVYVAVENIFVKEPKHRWWLTFFFGLVHGFGFANVLREMGLPTHGLIRCLLAFNVGVEVGQLAIATALLPLAMVLARWRHGRKVVVAISLLLAIFGTAWFIDRALGLEAMPF
ncbi:MAG TPA: HupE/UreJ family protein [Pirellulaceae bacterium]|nr:HupE/UreJ family protein [Pirellulaceae bacterium]